MVRVRSCNGKTLASVPIGIEFGIEMGFEVMTSGLRALPNPEFVQRIGH